MIAFIHANKLCIHTNILLFNVKRMAEAYMGYKSYICAMRVYIDAIVLVSTCASHSIPSLLDGNDRTRSHHHIRAERSGWLLLPFIRAHKWDKTICMYTDDVELCKSFCIRTVSRWLCFCTYAILFLVALFSRLIFCSNHFCTETITRRHTHTEGER